MFSLYERAGMQPPVAVAIYAKQETNSVRAKHTTLVTQTHS